MLKQLCSPVNCFSSARCHVSCRKVTRRQHLRKKDTTNSDPHHHPNPQNRGGLFQSKRWRPSDIFYKDTNLETAPRTEAAKPQKTPFKTQGSGFREFLQIRRPRPCQGPPGCYQSTLSWPGPGENGMEGCKQSGFRDSFLTRGTQEGECRRCFGT